ncbi:MAG: hypothetical protein JNL11_14395 [Bdellovibrionaceae bacterium]|nr:hypothetical protein [Pseudobdellovibrionaceae bacterium]
MKLTKKNKNKFLKNEKGQGMVEYILLLVVIIGLVLAFKPKVEAYFTKATDKVGSGMDGVIGN